VGIWGQIHSIDHPSILHLGPFPNLFSFLYIFLVQLSQTIQFSWGGPSSTKTVQNNHNFICDNVHERSILITISWQSRIHPSNISPQPISFPLAAYSQCLCHCWHTGACHSHSKMGELPLAFILGVDNKNGPSRRMDNGKIAAKCPFAPFTFTCFYIVK
jgi:hypothetical protein